MSVPINFGKRQLDGKVAIITGASRGLGKAISQVFVDAQMHLVLVARDKKSVESIAQDLRNSGQKIVTVIGDVRDESFCNSIVENAVQHFGKIDVLVNNAGVIGRLPIIETSTSEWKRVMETNLDAVFYLSRAAIQHMSSGSTIINVASTVSALGCANLVPYCASKGAVANFTRALALELAPRKITVNAISPGAMDSPMLMSEHKENVTEEMVRKMNCDSIPQGRIANVYEVARGALYLAQEMHSTGVILPIDGGYTAQ